MANKAAISGLAAVLLVAAIVGIVAGVLRTSNAPSQQYGGSSDSALSTTSKSVETVCSPTVHQDACKRALGKALNGSVEATDVIHAAVTATIEQVRTAFDHAANLSAKINDPVNKMAIKECRRLLNDAMDDLHAVLKLSHDLGQLLNRSDDIRTWLNAVISYQTACMENFSDKALKAEVDEAVRAVVQFASNALALFKEYASLTKDIAGLDLGGLDLGNVTLNIGRRLLSDYPSWISVADRRLLAVSGNGLGPGQMKPNVVVAQDGSGNFRTINEALAAMPAQYPDRYVIYVKAGTYNEYVVIDKNMPNVYMYGDGPMMTVVTGSRNFLDKYTTSDSATFVVIGQGFIAKDMAFTNTAGPAKFQAVALRVQGDMSAFFNCRIDAFQDTLYVQSNRQFYRNCIISGTIDFIFGDSFTIIQNCLLVLRRPLNNQQNIVTAMGRNDPKEDTAIVIQNCRIVPDQDLFPDRLKIQSYLGRPWKNFAQTVIMESDIGDVIQPAGYMEWPGNDINLPFYGEYANTGVGANTAGRVKWPGVRVMTPQEAQRFTAGVLLESNGTWLQNTGGEYYLGFKP